MALSDERIWASDAIMRANAAAGLPMPILGMLCRTVEAEVRKEDEALIQRMLAALERCRFDSLNMTIKDMQECGDAATAARARLAPPPPTA